MVHTLSSFFPASTLPSTSLQSHVARGTSCRSLLNCRSTQCKLWTLKHGQRLVMCKSSRGAENQKSTKIRRKKRHPPLRIQRGDLQSDMLGDIDLSVRVDDLELDKHIGLVAIEECGSWPVNVKVSVENTANAIFLNGKLDAKLSLKCTRCGSPFTQPIEGTFQAWVNPAAQTVEDCIDFEELPFPKGANYLNLTETVVDCMYVAMPRLCVCGGSSCVEKAVVAADGTPGWKFEDMSTPKPKGPFAGLEKLKEKLQD